MSPYRRSFAALVLMLTLAASGAAFAAPHRSTAAGHHAASAGLLGTLPGWLAHLWAEAGCILDPDGRCATAPHTDEGCILDPSGRCRQ